MDNYRFGIVLLQILINIVKGIVIDWYSLFRGEFGV